MEKFLKIPDIDIDTNNRENLIQALQEETNGKLYFASMIKENRITKHPTGIYFQDIPTIIYTEKNDETFQKISSIPYDISEVFGWIKIDILNNHSYDLFSSNKEIDELIQKEPNWNLLLDERFVKKLPHINKNFYLLKKYKPKNILELAAIISLIRPAKKHLIGKSMKEILEKVWKKEEKNEGYFFKKSHAISYAFLIVAVMNKLEELEKQKNQK